MTVRRLVYSVAMSLDGFIAGPDGSFDWIPADDDIDFAAVFDRFDTLVMGRGTWEVAQAAGQDPMPGMAKVVVSRTLAAERAAGARVFRDPVEAIEAVRAEPGRDLWLFGGGVLCGALLEAGLVDEIQVAVVPVILGTGLPLVADFTGRARLRLTDHRVYPASGITMLSYDVVDRGTGAK